jgi:hypothetical protein
MVFRRLQIVLAVFWFLWTSVLIPVHRRGIIPLAEGGAEKAACCSGGGERRPPVDEKSAILTGNCAICDLASRMSVSTGFVLLVPRAGVVGWRGMAREAAAVYTTEPSLPWRSRGPPGVA